MPSSPREFFKVFLQKVNICVTFHLLEFILCNRPVTFCVLGADTSNWIYEVERVIHRLAIKTQSPLDSPVSRPFICINQRAWLHVSLTNRQKHNGISPSDKLQIWFSGFILGVKYSLFTSALFPLLLVLNANGLLLLHDVSVFLRSEVWKFCFRGGKWVGAVFFLRHNF